jgi:hypothetical protein
MDGFQALEAIKRTPELTEIPILFLSSLDRPNLKVKGLQLGADDYIVKPFDQAELMARVGRALQRSERYRRLASGLSGDLGRISLEELLQTMGLGRRSASIELRDMAGKITTLNGDLVEARWRTFEGEPAFARLLLLANGRFAVDFDSVSPADRDTETTPINDLLFDTTVYLDEVRKILSPLLTCGSLLEPGTADRRIDSGVCAPPQWPATAAMVLACMSDELKNNARILLQEIEAGTLHIIDPEGD